MKTCINTSFPSKVRFRKKVHSQASDHVWFFLTYSHSIDLMGQSRTAISFHALLDPALYPPQCFKESLIYKNATSVQDRKSD